MSNPFKHNGEMLPLASINSVFVDNIKAFELFRPSLILEEIIANGEVFGGIEIPADMSLISMFDLLLHHELDTVKRKANDIAVKYGYRLAKVLSTLMNPSLESVSNRTNWTSSHWAFWASIRHIYLVGGLVAQPLIDIFNTCIIDEFRRQQISNVTVTFVSDSQHLGTKGMATEIDHGEYVLFDFGQTHIKRAYVVKNHSKIVKDQVLSPVMSQYLEYKNTPIEAVKELAVELDEFIVDTILHTANEVGFQGNDFYISIANYVHGGAIYSNRGGYGKLAYLAANYQVHLQQRLHQRLHRSVRVRLFHDTSAMALLFRNEDHCAVISLGTAFGIAFPEQS